MTTVHPLIAELPTASLLQLIKILCTAYPNILLMPLATHQQLVAHDLLLLG